MTPEQKAAYVQAQVACVLTHVASMTAANMQRAACNESMAYNEEDFASLITRYGIHHNTVMTLFHD